MKRAKTIRTWVANVGRAIVGTSGAALTRIVGPPGGRIVRYDRQLDSARTYVTDSPTFVKLKNLVRAGDTGNLASTLALFEEMEEKDSDTQSVANTRRLALTGLDWEVVSAADDQEATVDKTLADDAAAYVRETLTNLDSFDEALEHLGTAIGPNLAVLESVWQGNELTELVPVESHRLTQNFSESPDVRVITREEPLGTPATNPKFVIHKPGSISGFVFKKSLSRSMTVMWLVKQLCLADWATFCELFGMPIRIGKYGPGTTTEERRQLQDMLENMGSSAWAMVSEAAQIELKESSQRGTAPFEALINFCTRSIAKVWLGGHLTSDTAGGTGTYAAGAVQNEVREDIRDDDIRRESRTVRRQIIAPMCQFRFPGSDVPLPTFRRIKPDTVDYIQRAELVERASQRIGLPVGMDWAHEQLGIPKPSAEEATIQLVNPNPFGVEEGEF